MSLPPTAASADRSAMGFAEEGDVTNAYAAVPLARYER